ncbi:ABC transporter ATP-binding protein [Clostridium sp. WLY-B-L2]|jgi:NitT/TauT family transport system ATP-binding protein|uniref:ABC transporter ATP-binding protein n=1 Tax=Clostridium aromativorans TaxID=2836848 RepID=A0ABS8N5S9_9CLOT|nr:ABC transporter ATP-binding protein [Clostridium aromativorans]MCC9295180.1 ABC transporter ATP-binding protein [Clostridium aromativorans]
MSEEAVENILQPDFNTDVKLQVKNIVKKFVINKKKSGESSTVTILDDINLEVRKGEFLVIVGPSGCGKTTLLDIFAGLSKPTEGAVSIDGKAVDGPGLNRGIVFQQYALFPWLTTAENVGFVLESLNVKKKERDKIVNRLLALVGLSGFEDHYPHQLSGGMKQRAAIARALSFDPDILLMDEPFGALDSLTREILQRELLRIRNETNKTIIFITHSIDEAVFLADRVVIMTAKPGTIKKIVRISLSRHSRLQNEDIRSSKEFVQIRQELWNLIKEEVIKSKNF